MTTNEPHQAVDPARASTIIEAGVGRRGLMLAAAANFSVTQVVDRTTGVHGLIRKRDLR